MKQLIIAFVTVSVLSLVSFYGLGNERHELNSDSLALTICYEYDWKRFPPGKWRTKYTSQQTHAGNLYSTGKKQLVLAIRNDSPFSGSSIYQVKDTESVVITRGFKTGVALEALEAEFKAESSINLELGKTKEKTISIEIELLPYSEMSIYTVRMAQDITYRNVEQLQQHYWKWGSGIKFHDEGDPIASTTIVQYQTWNGFEIKGRVF